MTDDSRTRLIALLMRRAPDLAEKPFDNRHAAAGRR